MVATTTSIKEWHDCKRKWYLNRVAGLPQPPNKAFRIGSILHLCIERWLLCERDIVPTPGQVPDQPVDEFGNYTTGSVLHNQTPGQQVDLFPHEWWRYQDRDGEWHEIDEQDQALVKALVRHGIDEGTVRRLPGGLVEKKFWMPFDGNEGLLWLTSLADYHSPPLGILEDHKTTKSLRWSVTPETIADNKQLGIYALWMRDEYGIKGGIHVAHNIFIKDYINPRSKKVEGIITSQQTEDLRIELRQTIGEMLEMRDNAPPWEEVPPTWSSCDSYGGCPYRGVCSGLETIPEFQLRMNPPEAPQPQQVTAPPPLPTAANPAPVPAAPQPIVPTPALDIESARGHAPWADPGCPACNGLGVLSDGNSCSMCVQTTGKHPGNWTWGWRGGKFVVQLEAAPAPAPAPAPVPEPPAAPAPAPAGAQAEPEYEVVEDTHDIAQSAEAAPTSAPKPNDDDGDFRKRLLELDKNPEKKRGRPRKRFALFIDCTPDKTTRRIVQMGEVVRVLVAEFEAVHGMDYWTADTWKRRDWMHMQIASVVHALDKDALIVDSGLYEFRSFVSILEGHAEIVVRGVNR